MKTFSITITIILLSLFGLSQNRLNPTCKDSTIIKGDTSFIYTQIEHNEAAVSKTLTMEVFFEFDIDTIPNYELDKLLKKIKKKLNDFDSINKKIGIDKYVYKHTPLTVSLFGHTDYYGDKTYNINLSKKRVSFIKEYLIKKGLRIRKINFYGEEKPLYKNANKNRRVDVVIDYIDTWWGKSYNCRIDTVIRKKENKNNIIYKNKDVLATTNGSKNNISFTPYTTKPSFIANNLSTTDYEGNTLLSGGMFEVCNNSTRPIQVTITFYTCKIDSGMMFYNIDNANSWVKSNTPVSFGYLPNIKKYYYRFTISVPANTCNKGNADCATRTPGLCSGCGTGICETLSDTVKSFLENKELLKKKLTFKTKRGFHERSYLIHKEVKITLKSDSINKRKHTNILVDSCDLKNNIIVSVCQKRGKSYLMLKPIEEIPYRKWLKFLFGKRFILKKKFYSEININNLETELSKLIKD